MTILQIAAFVVLIIATTGVTSQSAPGPQLKCKGVSEQFYSCSSSCGDGCDLYRIDRVCTEQCLPGACACKKPDYFRNPLTNQCVYKDRCPTRNEYNYYGTPSGPICNDPNELYTECGPSCDTDGCIVPRYFAPCKNECKKGCFCKCGYHRKNDVCVEKSKCVPYFDNYNYTNTCPSERPPPRCIKAHEEWSSCGPACGDGCQKLHLQGVFCPTICKPGCYCKKGYLRDPRSGLCELQEKCPTPAEWDYKNNHPVCSKPNEHYSSCASGCGDDCKSFRAPATFCPAVCIAGCTCQKGYYRHPTTKECVPEASCPSTDEWDYENNTPKCKKPNEVYSKCGVGCGDGCRVYRLPDPACTAICKAGCRCKSGYFRHPVTGDCLPKDSCPTTCEWDYINNRPLKNEEYLENGSGCGDGCKYYVFPHLTCDKKPQAKGCFCKKGYHRDPRTGQCVTSGSCPCTAVWDYQNNKPIEVKACGFNERRKWLNRCWERCSRGAPTSCNQPLILDCFCTEGFCRNKQNQCVKPGGRSSFDALDLALSGLFEKKQRILDGLFRNTHQFNH